MAWLHLIEGWWRLFQRKAFAGQSLADDLATACVTQVATEHLNIHAIPWVWGWPPKPHRVLRRRFVIAYEEERSSFSDYYPLFSHSSGEAQPPIRRARQPMDRVGHGWRKWRELKATNWHNLGQFGWPRAEALASC